MHFTSGTLYLYIKNLTDLQETSAIRSHLTHCKACKKAYKNILKISSFLADTSENLPPSFYTRVQNVQKKRLFSFSRRPGLVFAVSIAGFAVSFGLLTGILTRSSDTERVNTYVVNTYKTFYDFDYYQELRTNNMNLIP